jgi:suppressor of tumorigenicity protein 13
LEYISSLQKQLGLDDDNEPANREHEAAMKEEAFPPTHNDTDLTSDDMDKAQEKKQEASEACEAGNWQKAVECYTEAVLASPTNPSALLYANRATVLLKLDRPLAAERDCNLALTINPDSAKAFRVRGKAYKALEKWELALKDLSAAQTIDFDEGTVEDLKICSEKHLAHEKAVAEERNNKEEKLRKKAKEIKEAQERAKREAAEAASAGGGGLGGMPGMGGIPSMGGMPGGMEGMMGLMQDPEIMEGMKNPKILEAFSQLMGGGGPEALFSNPGKLQELMSDPEVGPFMQKLMGKLGGGMGGMPGGMGGGGAPFGGSGGGDAYDDDSNDDDMDDIPDLEEM